MALYGCPARRLFYSGADLNRDNPGSNPLAAVSKLWQFRSSHVATFHSAVQMGTWLQTEVYI